MSKISFHATCRVIDLQKTANRNLATKTALKGLFAQILNGIDEV